MIEHSNSGAHQQTEEDAIVADIEAENQEILYKFSLFKKLVDQVYQSGGEIILTPYSKYLLEEVYDFPFYKRLGMEVVHGSPWLSKIVLLVISI